MLLYCIKEKEQIAILAPDKNRRGCVYLKHCQFDYSMCQLDAILHMALFPPLLAGVRGGA